MNVRLHIEELVLDGFRRATAIGSRRQWKLS